MGVVKCVFFCDFVSFDKSPCQEINGLRCHHWMNNYGRRIHTFVLKIQSQELKDSFDYSKYDYVMHRYSRFIHLNYM